ncbi:VPS53 (YJL029C) [Zygosaccharomyces parabailii]|uniref:BN860_09450g1_1 n=1 Tax=Zygosaccharomyces bailii (strain CLIB 213 / ATCC 58445 / CBS 680 / BCRC 21525 / NBRC 1098 / NCYC 1416 / NRRL Y-2227) TaxID=1333698 RepID=A0A8J2X777_ZYGB2|nr:VPS53 (YJL029C) [Zygosaccharomyces parabailii]CDF88404.1 BN860_09450g1_1 [Zygosaccharomyces bailii CLIB 213]CDH14713.1 probable Vacuolar protein sorting-associated protein 53 [Zygosaccharomyces bailii ISA1307]SJM82044.1 probable Vacuolar protein sorting-associated protein 53 [Zygosaccharomyces bailii]
MISDSIDYDPFEDITSTLSAKDSLGEIDQLICATRQYKLQLTAEIEQTEKAKLDATENVTETKFDFDKVFREIDETKHFSSTTQSTISQLTEGISHLDNAKRNLTQCMTLFQNLKILTDSYFQCKELIRRNAYKEMASSYKIMCSLAENTFKPHKSVDDINKLLASISRLKAETFDKIKHSYSRVLSGKAAESEALEAELREGACDILDSDSSDRAQIIDICLKKLLSEIGEIFRVDDEAGSLENLSRRYIFFKKILNSFNSKYARYFLPEWQMSLKLTSAFYKMTAKDLEILLKKEFQDKNASIDLFMGALQATLDFEKYIDVRFSNKMQETKLSVYFEPYLSLWVSHQDKMMNDKLLSYMGSGDLSTTLGDSLVVPSSADLFRTYRTVLTQTFELIENNTNNGILVALANFFTKWLIAYSNRILKPLVLPDNEEIQNKEEAIKYTVTMINTVDYCSVTVGQLEDKLAELSPDPEKISQNFAAVKDSYDGLLAKGNSILLHRILALDLAFVAREFNNIDWARVVVENYSRYMVTLKEILCFNTNSDQKSTLQLILSQFNRDVYSWNFLDKVIDLITQDFTGYIIRLLQPMPPFATLSNTRKFDSAKVTNIGEQLLLDTELLKEIFHSLPGSVSDEVNSTQTTAYKRVQKHIDTNLTQILQFIKVLMTPLSSVDDYHEAYKKLTNDNTSSSVWAYLLTLKGIPWDLTLWKQHWSAFDMDRDLENGSDGNNDLFIFKWNTKLITQFEFNMLRIQEPLWAKFIKDDLQIKPPSRTISKIRVPSKPYQSPPLKGPEQPQSPQNSLGSPLANVRNMVTNNKFFDRSGQ